MRAKTPSFIAEFPLRTTAADAAAINTRLDTARQIYNACLGESLRRLQLMRDSKDWQRARSMPKGKERTALFKATTKRFRFDRFAIQKAAEECRDACWIGEHLGSHDTQTTSLRAFRAVQQYAFGKRGRPRFKGKNRLDSIEGKSTAVIQFKPGPVPAIHWFGLVLSLKLDPKDKHGWQARALACRTKFVRIVRRRVHSKVRFYAQLVQEGAAPLKYQIGNGTVGLDIGPSTIAAVSEADAALENFCPTVEDFSKEIRRLQRTMDRSRRATNPDNYEPDGTITEGAKTWVRSSRYLKLRAKLAEIERKLVSERKRSHGEHGNRVLAGGDVINLEKVSYRSFQKNFGRSVKRRAPGLYVSMLKRKAEGAGAIVMEFATRSTKLSQFCHVSGACVKKPLSQRHHEFPDGSRVQRDLYSAWLARFVEGDTLDASRLAESWKSAGPLLQAASRHYQSATGAGFPHPNDRRMKPVVVRADRLRKGVGHGRDRKVSGEAADAVATKPKASKREPRRASPGGAPGTPGL